MEMVCRLNRVEISGLDMGATDRVAVDFKASGEYDFSMKAIDNGAVIKGIMYCENEGLKETVCRCIFDIVEALGKGFNTSNSEGLKDNEDVSEAYLSFCYQFKIDTDVISYSYKRHRVSGWICDTCLRINGEDVYPETGVFYEYFKQVSNFVRNMKFISFMDLTYRNKFKRDCYYEIAELGKTLELEAFLHRNNCKVRLGEFTDEVTKVKDIIVRPSNTSGMNTGISGNKERHYFRDLASSGENILSHLFYYKLKMGKYSFVMMDDIGSFLYYASAEDIITGLTDEFPRVQIFIFSYNTDLLSNDILRPDCYYLVDGRGVNQICHLTERRLRKAHHIQNMFKRGEYHTTPRWTVK